MLIVKHVETNAKVGADVELGPKTLIVGPNGSGKSTIVNAVELALTGRVSDIAGRTDVAREADVMQLAPHGDTILVASCDFSDGGVAQYKAEGTVAKAKKAVRVTHAAAEHDEVLPIRTLKEAVLGSAATARKFLLSKVAGEVTRDDVADLMPDDATKATWKQQVGLIAKSISAPDALVLVVEKAGTLQREASARAKSSREAAKLVGGGRAAPPSKKELAEAAEARRVAHAALVEAQGAQGHSARLAGYRAELATCTAQAEQAVTDLAMREAELTNTDEPKPPHPAFPAILTVMEASLEQGGDCLACGGAKISQGDADFVRGELGGYSGKRRAYDALVADVRQRKTAAERLIAQIDRLEAELSREGDTSAPQVSLADAQAAFDTADKRHNEMKAAADAWASVKKAEAAATEADEDVETWKAFKSACEAAVGVILGRALEAFQSRVQAHLPQGDTFELRLAEGDREVVAFGLVRGGYLDTALSGAEWARVITAMACACTPDERFAVLIPEERAFDPRTLAAVMEAFTPAPHQVILCSPVPPAHVPAGWTVVERGA